MTATRFYLCALPGQMWEQTTSVNGHSIDIRPFVSDALRIEQRLTKGVNQENERVRYNLCCVRIEAALAPVLSAGEITSECFRTVFDGGRLPAGVLEEDYLELLAKVIGNAPSESAESRLGASFFPPATVAAHRSAFQRLAEQAGVARHSCVERRLAFFAIAEQFECGVIELQAAFQSIGTDGTSQRMFVQSGHPPLAEHAFPLDQVDAESDDEIAEDERLDLYDILRRQVQDAIRGAFEGRPGGVNFSNQPHNVITEVLHEFAYGDSDPAAQPVLIKVVYTDGSQGQPFPLLGLPRRAEPDLVAVRCSPPLRVALLSMRHLEMDRDVDMAWFRNREVSKSRTFAETDHFCYQQTRAMLREARSEGDLQIHVLQTGLQPAVVGFYRALIEELLERAAEPPSLEVTPYYFGRRTGYRPGRAWS